MSDDAQTTEQRPDVAIRPLLSDDAAAILHAMLQATDYGVLLTDLEHRTLACNRRFGEIFEVSIEAATLSDVEELRAKVHHLISDLARWRANLEAIYADPDATQEDELTLLKRPLMTLRRFTGPVLNAQGEVIGRLWTFLDISKEVRQRRFRETLHELSRFYANDPKEVYQAVVEAIARFYPEATVWLGVREGETLALRAAAGARAVCLTGRVPLERTLTEAILRADRPLLLENLAEHPAYRERLEAQFGTRFLGVPCYDNARCPAGTLSLADDHADAPFDEEDIQFLTLLSMRISAEVAREAYLNERLEEQRATLRRQQAHLTETQEVLAAMNGAFALLGTAKNRERLLDGQIRLLQGKVGVESAAILLQEERGEALHGRLLKRGQRRPQAETLALADAPELARWLRKNVEPITYAPYLPEAWRQRLGSGAYGLARLEVAGQAQGVLILGRDQTPAPDHRLHFTHLEAIREQVALLLSTFLLQSQLRETHQALRDTQEKLIQSEKLSIVGTLAAATAHDIRNILTPLQVELLSGKSDPQEALETMQQTLTRLMALTHRLLAYARPTRRALAPVSLPEVVRVALSLMDAQRRHSSVELSLEIEETLPPMVGDPHRLEHLFINLILNAIHAMEPNGGRLRITLRRAKNGVRIEVADTGRGIPPEIMAHLFEPFHSTHSEGFGVGLFGCRRIVEEHEGKISVETAPGQGATFHIFLPSQAKLVSK